MKLPIPCLAALAIVSTASAATIIDFDFSGVNGTVSHDPDLFELTATTTLDPNLTLVEGINVFNDSVLNFATAGAATSNDLNLVDFGGSTSASILAGLAGNRYFSFIIQADSGYQLNLDGATISFDLRRNGGGASKRFGITAEIDPTNDDSITVGDQLGSNIDVTVTTPQTITRTFSGTQWDGITGQVEVRLYGWNGGTTGNTHFSDAVIDGATITVVPEPYSAALLGALSGLALLRRRRD